MHSGILASSYTDFNKIVLIHTVSSVDGVQLIAPKIPLHLLTLPGSEVIRRQRCLFEMDLVLILIGGIIDPGQRIVKIDLHRVRRCNAVSDRYRVSFYFRALLDIAGVIVIAAENTKHRQEQKRGSTTPESSHSVIPFSRAACETF